ncbi:MAG: hypothetical protein QF921_00630 [Pseudomonadales bacterium]|nr:hypothetical protein [Kiritimatiellia bacterium]MDP6970020.1 hypothetical protein [Pseudomonadales bacterium]
MPVGDFRLVELANREAPRVGIATDVLTAPCQTHSQDAASVPVPAGTSWSMDIRGRVHPAYWWGFAAIAGMAPFITALSLLPTLQQPGASISP